MNSKISAVNKEITPGFRPGIPDLAEWRDFGKALASLVDIHIMLYASDGSLLSVSGKDTCACAAIKRSKEGRHACREQYAQAVSDATIKRQVFIYKCHANQYLFALPVVLSPDTSLVVVGGRSYVQGREIKDFYEGMLPYSISRTELAELKNTIRTIPARSVFTVPGIVHNLAMPYLKSMYAESAPKALTAEAGKPLPVARPAKEGPEGFEALEEIYGAIATVLDREELYRTILAKSTELLGAETASLMILDAKRNMLQIKASKGLDTGLVERVRVPLGEGISGSIAARGRPMLVSNIDTLGPSLSARDRYKTKSFVAIPIKIGSRVIGVLNVTDKTSGASFSDTDLRLLLSVASYASIALERGAYYSMTEELKLISMTDPLTGLFNRRYFMERLFEEVERVKRHNESFSAFMLDIDNFKSLNDRYGHSAGDDVLLRVSRAIRDAVRSMDVVARHGGEEFSVLLPHTSKSDAMEIAERVRSGVERSRPLSAYPSVVVTVSIGVAEFPDDASTIDELVDRADRAMYRAKKAGKNRVIAYDGSPSI